MLPEGSDLRIITTKLAFPDWLTPEQRIHWYHFATFSFCCVVYFLGRAREKRLKISSEVLEKVFE
jgi:hypothetical protein